MASFNLIQVNLNKSVHASNNLSDKFIKDKLDIALIQEPRGNEKRILGLKGGTTVCDFDGTHVPRACILVRKGIVFFMLREFSDRDLIAINLNVLLNGSKLKLTIASGYHAKETQIITGKLEKLSQYCTSEGRQLIYGCDSNAHNKFWSDTKTDARGNEFLSFIALNKFEILNRGAAKTFSRCVTKQGSRILPQPIFQESCIDLTVVTACLEDKILDWEVLEEDTMSDHKYIRFSISNTELTPTKYRNPKRTNWEKFNRILKQTLKNYTWMIGDPKELDHAAKDLNDKLINAYKTANIETLQKSKGFLNELTSELVKKKKQMNKHQNRIKHCRRKNLLVTDEMVSNYKEARADYQKSIEKEKRKGWKRMTGEIEDIKTVARFQKLLSKENPIKLGTVKDKTGVHAKNEKDILAIMANTHFPDCTEAQAANLNLETNYEGASNEEIKQVSDLFSSEAIKWALNEFKPYKTAGPDGIFPALLQKGSDLVIPHLKNLMVNSYLLNYIPESWRKAEVTFIPKIGKSDYSDPKSFRPISLSSFFLKTMEKIIDRHIRMEILSKNPLNKNQFAYQTGKSTETALKLLTKKIEKTIGEKGYRIAAFMDIMGAFDNTSFESISEALERRGINRKMRDWIQSMLKGRVVRLKMGDYNYDINTVKGCPQGGVLSPLLWTLVVDELLNELEKHGFEAIGFADDIVLTMGTKSNDSSLHGKKTMYLGIAARMNKALRIVEKWCEKVGLSVNPEKTKLIMFTKNRAQGFKKAKILLFNQSIKFCEEVKFLGLTLDASLNWKSHIKNTLKKATNALWTSKKLVGRKWGLKPIYMKWIYETIARPILSYGVICWWKKLSKLTIKKKMEKLQRLACNLITPAPRSTPTKAMEILLEMLPLDLFLMKEAVKTNCRLRITDEKETEQIYDYSLTASLGRNHNIEEYLVNSDSQPKILILEKKYSVNIGDRKDFVLTARKSMEEIICFTDGSKSVEGTGSGVYLENWDEKRAYKLDDYATVFLAEIFAIYKCSQVLGSKDIHNCKIIIYSDSMAALKALDKNWVWSKLVAETKKNLNSLGQDNVILLNWVPAHSGHQGNETADILAKKGAGSKKRPRSSLGVPKALANDELNSIFFGMALDRFKSSEGLRISKVTIVTFNKNRYKCLINMSRDRIYRTIGFLTGHFPLVSRLARMGIASNEINCRFCLEEEETTEHILCECVALDSLRFRELGSYKVRHLKIKDIFIGKISAFLSKLELH